METQKENRREKLTFSEVLDQINKQLDLNIKQSNQRLEQSNQRLEQSNQRLERAERMGELIDRLMEASNQSTASNVNHDLKVVFRERKMILPYILKPTPIYLRVVR